MRWGWWSLAVFLTLGLVLEALHGFKLGFYLDVHNQTRRHMWTLAHAHGTLLGLVHIAFAASLRAPAREGGVSLTLSSRCLTAAGVYSNTGSSSITTALIAAPRAWPSFSADAALRDTNTCSTATSCGRHSSNTSWTPAKISPRRCGKPPAALRMQPEARCRLRTPSVSITP